MKTQHKQRKLFTGKAASPGYVIANIKLIARQKVVISHQKISKAGIAGQIEFFNNGILQVKKEISNLRDLALRMAGKEESNIFDSHLMILQDPFLVENTVSMIKNEQYNASYAFHLCMQNLMDSFESSGGILKERFKI